MAGKFRPPDIETYRARRFAALFFLVCLGLVCTGLVQHIALVTFCAGALTLPGCLTRCIRYRRSFDYFFLLTNFFLLVGVTAQPAGESFLANADPLARTELILFTILSSFGLMLVFTMLAMLEVRWVRAGEVALRLKGLSQTDRFLYWAGFASLGRSPGLVQQEIQQVRTEPGLEEELRRRRKSLFAMGIVIVAMMLPGIWLAGNSSSSHAGTGNFRFAGILLLGPVALIGGCGYSYWLWRLSRLTRARRRFRHRMMRCVNCGYLLHGLSSHRCPECGTPF